MPAIVRWSSLLNLLSFAQRFYIAFLGPKYIGGEFVARGWKIQSDGAFRIGGAETDNAPSHFQTRNPHLSELFDVTFVAIGFDRLSESNLQAVHSCRTHRLHHPYERPAACRRGPSALSSFIGLTAQSLHMSAASVCVRKFGPRTAKCRNLATACPHAASPNDLQRSALP